METKYTSLTLTLLVLYLNYDVQAHSATFDITKYGGKPDSDITQAFEGAWKEACASTAPSAVVIPKGSFLMNPVEVKGPCKSPIEIQLQGTVKAPEDTAQYKDKEQWIYIGYVSGLTITGGGTFDGQGAKAWDMKKKNGGENLPYNLALSYLNNSVIRGVASLNAKGVHVQLLGANNVTFDNFSVTAPEDSPNTDGIHMGRCGPVTIRNSIIKTGDDCISIGYGTKDIHIEGVTCGPGHGISIGSLGKYEDEQEVKGIFVKNCTFINTDNGARIKTWPDAFPCVATDIHFEDLTMTDVEHPIIVDQEYCPDKECKSKAPSKVKLSKLFFKNIKGTSRSHETIKLLCSKTLPCEGVELADIDLTYNGKEGPAIANCTNVMPQCVGKVNPSACGGSAKSQ